MVHLPDVGRIGAMSNSEFMALHEQIRDQLSSALSASRDLQAEAAEPRTGYGACEEGEVSVTVDSKGLLQHVEFSPDIAHLTSEELGEAVLEAVGAARADVQGQSAPRSDPAAVLQDRRFLEAYQELIQPENRG